MLGFFVSCTMPFAGIDVGGTYIKYGLVEESGKIVHQERVETRADDGRDAVIQRILSAARTLSALRTSAFRFRRWSARSGQAMAPSTRPLTYLDGTRCHCSRSWRHSEYHRGGCRENDANAAALAESRFGAGRNHPDFLYVTLGTGVGGGVILNNELYRGPHGDAGEVGHILLPESVVSGQESVGRHSDPRAFREDVLESFIGSQILARAVGDAGRESVTRRRGRAMAKRLSDFNTLASYSDWACVRLLLCWVCE